MKDPMIPEAKQFSSADFTDGLSEDGSLLVTAAEERKQKRKVRLLLILTLLCVLLGVSFICNQTLNYYDRTINALSFDYRQREEVDPAPLPEAGEKAQAVAASVGSSVKVSTVEMWFDAQEKLANTLSGMEYEYSSSGETLSVRTGIRDWFLTKKRSLRRTSGKSEEELGETWNEVSDAEFPCLYDFFFAVEDSDMRLLQCSSSYATTVGSTRYTCEIWLLQTVMNGQIEYFTLYRYYGENGRLAAVRVLQSGTTMMAVYEIKDYSAF